MQPLQYIHDASGKPTAVVVPIDEWKDLMRQLQQGSSVVQEPAIVYTMGDFIGTLPPAKAETLLKEVEQSRNEWDRGS